MRKIIVLEYFFNVRLVWIHLQLLHNTMALDLLQLYFSLLITLPCTWDLVAGTCTTEETRRLALNRVMASQGCNHYHCGKYITLGIIRAIYICA